MDSAANEVNSFPQAGEVCPSCKERWELRKRKTQTLQGLPVDTANKHIPVAICSYCDGEPIFRLAWENHRASLEK